jgi:hypothetical protein
MSMRYYAEPVPAGMTASDTLEHTIPSASAFGNSELSRRLAKGRCGLGLHLNTRLLTAAFVIIGRNSLSMLSSDREGGRRARDIAIKAY